MANPFLEAGVAELTRVAGEVNRIAEQLNAASNSVALVHEVRNTSEDEKIAAFRQYKDELDKRILAAELEIDQYIVDSGFVNVVAVDEAALTTTHKALVDEFRRYEKAIAGIDGYAELSANVPNLVSLKGKELKSGADGRGAGVKKSRLDKITVDGVEAFGIVKNKDGTERHAFTFTALGPWLAKKAGVKSVDSSDIRTQAFEAAGTDDLGSLNGRPFSFSYSVADKNYMIEVTPSVSE